AFSFGGFFLLVAGILGLSAWINTRHAWVAIEREPIFGYVPSGAHLVDQSHTGWANAPACEPNARCEYVRYYAGPLPASAALAQVEKELVASGFVLRAPNGTRCPEGYRKELRYARGEISVWPSAGPTPYAIGHTRTIPLAEGASVVRLAIDNMQIVWGC